MILLLLHRKDEEMVSTKLFSTEVDIINRAGGVAYALSPKQALTQYVCMGTLGNTYYASDVGQLVSILNLSRSEDINSEYIAKLAVYSRTNSWMKNVPVLLLLVLLNRDVELFEKIFPVVIDNGEQLRTFCQMIRSGVAGRNSFGAVAKRCVNLQLNVFGLHKIIQANIGNNPSLKDVIKMTHPKPKNEQREALFSWVINDGKINPEAYSVLPAGFKKFEDLKRDSVNTDRAGFPWGFPDFRYFSSLGLNKEDWAALAKSMDYMGLRMNLINLNKHGVFSEPKIVEDIARRISDRNSIIGSRQYPYQFLSAYIMGEEVLPPKICNALQDAMEISIENVPIIDTNFTHICVDVSGSMGSPITGYRKGATSKVTCKMVASLFATALLRKNPNSCFVYPFDTMVYETPLNSKDSVMTNVKILNGFGGGGTDCSCVLRTLNKKKVKGDLVILISDMESWKDTTAYHKGTGVINEFNIYSRRNEKAKLVCMDLQPNKYTQARDNMNILNIGGFNDNIFDIVKLFVENDLSSDHWVDKVEKTEI